jgi:tRNA threonylcarbamoyladenosine biosynthesis protein TsaB
VNILALDTATTSTVAALLTADGAVREERDELKAQDSGERPRHATRLLGLAAGLLAEGGLGWQQLDRIAVGIGPGTFTGLRIGIATARGLALASRAELVGVCTLRAIGCSDSAERSVLTVLDARRGEAFVAAYRGRRELVAPAVVAPERIASLAPSGSLAVGDGAVRFRDQLEGAGVAVAPDGSPLHRVSAKAIGRLAAADDVDSRGSVTPLYLRLPDAELGLQSTTR